MMNCQCTKGFLFYDFFYFGITRGYIHAAVNQSDLAEGVQWLSLAQSHAFPSVESAWQRIRQLEKIPNFERGQCPLCKNPVMMAMEWSHLLMDCTHERVHRT
jgi:hypothetical protein